jgi:hypothetical protein
MRKATSAWLLGCRDTQAQGYVLSALMVRENSVLPGAAPRPLSCGQRLKDGNEVM